MWSTAWGALHLNRLEKNYDILRLRDVIVKSEFDIDKNSLITMYSFCSAFRRYNHQFDRFFTGDFVGEDKQKLDSIYSIMVENAKWEDGDI